MGRIIYVEDSKDTARAVKLILDKSGHNVELAHTGTDGLEKLKKGSYDLAILDIMLPDMSGIDVFGKAQKHAKKNCKYVFLSILPISTDQMSKLKKKGAYGHISKPFKKDELVKIIDEIVKSKKKAAANKKRKKKS